MLNGIQKSAGLMPSSGIEASKGLEPTGGLASHKNKSRKNIDDAFDDFMPAGQGGGGGAAGINPFTITDATEAGVEKFSVSPGYLEVNTGSGVSTRIMPTMGGDPLDNEPAPALNAVDGDVYLEITVDVLGVPTGAEVKNATTMPVDTALLKYVKIGVIEVDADLVTVTDQIVTSDIFFGASPKKPFQATTGLDGDDVVLTEIAYGLILRPLMMAPEAFVIAATSAVGDAKTHAWVKVEWDADYEITAAALEFGTEWPGGPPYSVAEKYINIPVAYIATGQLVQVTTGNIMLHQAFTAAGSFLTPAAL